jgi:5-methylcytosine-specific restriction endonuclease McrA
MPDENENFFSARRCLLEPIEEIFEAAKLLDEAADAHLEGNRKRAEALIGKADNPAITRWTEAIWGSGNQHIHRFREVEDAPPWLARDLRPRPRAPGMTTKKSVIARDRYRCRFCGIPVINRRVRELLRASYPKALRWGATNAEQHSAFQCMWLQYDHVLPNSRGGESSLANLIITCGPCNFGRMERTLAEVGLIDPRSMPILGSSWDGLERLFVTPRAP